MKFATFLQMGQLACRMRGLSVSKWMISSRTILVLLDVNLVAGRRAAVGLRVGRANARDVGASVLVIEDGVVVAVRAGAAVGLRVVRAYPLDVGAGVLVVVHEVVVAVAARAAVGLRVVRADAGLVRAGVLVVEDPVAIAVAARATVRLRVGRADARHVGAGVLIIEDPVAVVVGAWRRRRGERHRAEGDVEPDGQDVGVFGAKSVVWLEDLRVADERPEVEASGSDAEVVTDVGIHRGTRGASGDGEPRVPVEPERGLPTPGERMEAKPGHRAEVESSAVVCHGGVGRRRTVCQSEQRKLRLNTEDLAERELPAGGGLGAEPVLALLGVTQRVREAQCAVQLWLICSRVAARNAEERHGVARQERSPAPHVLRRMTHTRTIRERPRGELLNCSSCGEPFSGADDARAGTILPMRIIVVESDPVTADILETAFPNEHEIVCLGTGLAALERIAIGRPFDLVFCEVDPPDMTAKDFYGRLEDGSPRTALRTVLMLSELKPHRAFLEKPPKRFLLRPITVSALREVMAAIP